jgi:elongation factor G
MKVYDAPSIRNVAIVGHGGCGKTSLVAAMLFNMGAVNRLGRVDDGSTVTDFDPDEIERKISLQTALAYGEWRKVKLNLLDAPGYANFLAEARAALRVAETALVVVDAVAGVEVQAEKVWGYAEEYGLARLIVVNREDRDRASFLRALESLQRVFGRSVVPVAIPLGEEKGFVGVADILTGRADVYADDQSGKYQAVDIPAEVREAAQTWREKLLEMVAETDEKLMEQFFESGTLTQESFLGGLRQAVMAGKLFPVFPASSLRNVGIHPLLDALVDITPSPADRGEILGTDPVQKRETVRKPTAEGPLSAFVFKSLADPHAGRISLFRVYSGTLRADSTVFNANRDTVERVGTLELLQGEPDAHQRDPGRRHRSGGQAQGNPDRGHPFGQGAAHRLPSGGARRARHHLRHRAQDPRR